MYNEIDACNVKSNWARALNTVSVRISYCVLIVITFYNTDFSTRSRVLLMYVGTRGFRSREFVGETRMFLGTVFRVLVCTYVIRHTVDWVRLGRTTASRNIRVVGSMLSSHNNYY